MSVPATKKMDEPWLKTQRKGENKTDRQTDRQRDRQIDRVGKIWNEA